MSLYTLALTDLMMVM